MLVVHGILSCQGKRPAFGTASRPWEVSASTIAALHKKKLRLGPALAQGKNGAVHNFLGWLD
jgi:hypothetical protein